MILEAFITSIILFQENLIWEVPQQEKFIYFEAAFQPHAKLSEIYL